MEKLANPAPLGLLAFGMTTVLLNIHNAGFYPIDSMILGMGVFYGGMAQLIAGSVEFKKGNTFAATAFTSYGCFWLALVALLVFPSLGWAEAPSPLAMGCFLTIWGLLTFCLFIGTLKLNRCLQVVFASLALLFFLLAAGNFSGSEAVMKVAGIEGIFCGFSAIYGAVAQVLNEVYGRDVLPMG